tara:strand:- start:457 stop:1707 length:1251 start_codon:yes stop_codon:yes gene_type:complete
MDNYLDSLNYFGITHKYVSHSEREYFALSEDEIVICYSFIEQFNLNELFIISTCGRTEFYSCSNKKNLFKFISFIYEHFNKPCNLDSLKYLGAIDCVKQLIQVSCGIDSQLIGETEITNQIKKSFKLSKDHGASKSILTRLVQTSLEAGKKARSKTKLSEGSLSISYAAIDKISKIVNDLEHKSVLIIGAGMTGKSVSRRLKKKGVKNIFISNRSNKRGISLSKKIGAKFIKFDDYLGILPKVDIVITCTSAQYNLITTRDIINVLDENPSILFMDLALPSNIEKSANYIPNTKVLNLDDVNDILDEYYILREKELPQVNQIIEEMIIEYIHWLYELKVTPAISNLKHYYEEILDDEILKVENKYDSKTLETLEKFSNALIKKYLKGPISFLKSDTISENNKRKYINFLKSIYKIK